MTSIISRVRNKRSSSPIAQRLLERCIQYQQQEQNSQNHLTSSSSSSSSLTTNQVNDINQKLKKRIKDLLKPIRKSRYNGSVEEFERAITGEDQRTKCVLIVRPTNNSKEPGAGPTPVVEYCRLWRWSDLTSQNELKPLDFCTNAFHYELDHICVNPYHYERVPNIYAVHVPRLSPNAVQNISTLYMTENNHTVIDLIPENRTYEAPFLQPSPLPFTPESIASQDSTYSPGNNANGDGNTDIPTPMDYEDTENTLVVQSNPPLGSNAESEQVSFQELPQWCHILYYELSTRVGQPFSASQSQVIIDGFTNPSDAERFCLGSLANIERTLETNEVRRHIGRGVKLFHIRGNVFAECLSDSAVFVQSPIANRRFSWHPATVCKIPPNVRLQIFDSDEFTRVLACAIHEGYEAVYNLMKMCIIRMSLVKGWGADYPRKSITNTPCWIEIFLDGPLKWIDSVLFTMRGPNQSITSFS